MKWLKINDSSSDRFSRFSHTSDRIEKSVCLSAISSDRLESLDQIDLMLKTEKVGRDKDSRSLLSLLIVILFFFRLGASCLDLEEKVIGLLPICTGMLWGSSTMERSVWLNQDASLSGTVREDMEESLVKLYSLSESESIPSSWGIWEGLGLIEFNVQPLCAFKELVVVFVSLQTLHV